MRLVTWNTWWRFGPDAERQPLLAATLARVAPDVVLLQETWPEQAASLAEACGLTVVGVAAAPFEPPVLDSVAADHPFGNAVLARSGQAEPAGVVALTSSTSDAAPRFAVGAWIDLGTGDRLLVVSTHLCHLAEGGEVRAAQLDEVHHWTRRLTVEGPVVVGGDLNLVPSSPEYGSAVAAQWVDLWGSARSGDPGSTMVPGNPRLRSTGWMADRNPPGAAPGVRLDYLLARRPSPIAVVAIDSIGGADDGWPSDHLGLVADVDVPASD